MSKTAIPPKQPKGPGAPRTASNDLPIYDSLNACSGATGIPLSVLKQAKKGGCDAFKSTRVDLGKLLRWLFGKDQDGEGSVNWGERYKRVQTLRGELALDREKKELANRGEIRDAVRVIQSTMYSELEQTFCHEFPPDAKGLGEIPIRDKAKDAIKRVQKTLDRKFEEMENA
jgi:hypothetical protein